VVRYPNIKPHVQSAELDTTVKITCEDQHTITWKFEGGPLPSNVVTFTSQRFYTYDVNIIHILLIEGLKNKNIGSYQCLYEDKEQQVIFYDTAKITVDDEYYEISRDDINMDFILS